MEKNKIMHVGVYSGPGEYDVEDLPTIIVNLNISVPFLSLSQCEGVGAVLEPSGIEYNLSRKSVTSDSSKLDAKCKLRVCGLSVEIKDGTSESDIDFATTNPDYTGKYDRYVTIALLESIITKREMVVIFDKVDGVYFVMPPVYYFKDSISEKICDGNKIHMEGYYIGVPQASKELVNSTSTVNKVKYTLPSEDVLEVTTHLIEVQILGSRQSNFDGCGVMLDDNNYVESTKVSVIEMISLGDSTKLTENGETHISKLAQVSGVNRHAIRAGKKNISDILIPLYV